MIRKDARYGPFGSARLISCAVRLGAVRRLSSSIAHGALDIGLRLPRFTVGAKAINRQVMGSARVHDRYLRCSMRSLSLWQLLLLFGLWTPKVAAVAAISAIAELAG